MLVLEGFWKIVVFTHKINFVHENNIALSVYEVQNLNAVLSFAHSALQTNSKSQIYGLNTC